MPAPDHATDADARPRADGAVLDAVEDLRRDVAATAFPLPVDGAKEAEEQRRRLLSQLDDQLLPRLRELAAPALVVVAGSTGAGKSTLVNSVLQTEVSAAGVLRPTTRRPVLAHHPADADFLVEHPLVAVSQLVTTPQVPRGVVLVDAPDLDSLEADNRALARRLLDAADLWVFVTTAARYGDAVPWEVLGQGAERGTALAVVLNRVPPDVRDTVRPDLLARLRERGLGDVPLFLVPDLGPHQGPLDERDVAPLRRWLTMVAGPARARTVVRRTQRGTLRALEPMVAGLADAVQAQVDARGTVERAVQEALAGPAERAVLAVRGGAVADGPVRARWSGYAGRAGVLGGRWHARRAGAERASALALVREEVERSATVVLEAARRYAEDAVLTGLVAAAPSVGGDLAARAREAAPVVRDVDAATADAAAWVEATRVLVARARDADRSAAAALRRLERACGPEGAVGLVLAAAAGMGAARVLLAGTLGPAVTEQLAGQATSDLLDRVRASALSAGDVALGLLGTEHLADDAAARLRLRLAVLKGLR